MRDKFIPTNNDLSYYPLLFKACEETNGEVIEMGIGHGSTPLLHEYSKVKKRKLHSYETQKEWLKKFEHLTNDLHSFTLIDPGAWDACSAQHPSPSVVFIDHAPGERRKVDIILFKPLSEIIVIHDTEPHGAGNYRVRPLFKEFKYVVDVKSNCHDPMSAGAWATAVSDRIDLTKWIGEKFGEYSISAWQK